MLCNQKISEIDKKLWQGSQFSTFFIFLQKFWIVYSQNSTLVPLKRDLYTVSDSSEFVVVNFMYLKIMFLEHENQGWEDHERSH